MSHEMIALLIATMGTILLQAFMHQRSMKFTLYQHEQSVRYLQSQNDKLSSKLMAMVDASAYLQFRAGSAQGVPEGSMPQPTLSGSDNGSTPYLDRARIDRIQAEVLGRLKERGMNLSSAGPYEEGNEP